MKYNQEVMELYRQAYNTKSNILIRCFIPIKVSSDLRAI